jgi:hypothetical protein
MRTIGPIKSRKLSRENSWTVRMLYCENYNCCLDFAAACWWPAFSCIECKLWDINKRTINIGDKKEEDFYDQRSEE